MEKTLQQRLFHRNVIAYKDVMEVAPAVDENLLAYLKRTCDLRTAQKIVDVPRSSTSFEHGGLFPKPAAEISVHLNTLEATLRGRIDFRVCREACRLKRCATQKAKASDDVKSR